MSASRKLARIIVAGVASGVGKTTLCTGLMSALAARGLRIQGYKVGPDYIDPTYHQAATGRPSYNLDTWLSSQALVRQRFEVGMRNADVAVIEGVMGLFDGRKQTRDTASTAEIARLLDAPVLLVIDVSRMGQSVAAIVSGFQRLDSRVHIAGVILNKVASSDHEATLRYALAEWTGLPVLGAIYRDPLFVMPARQLGLVPASETSIELQALGQAIEHRVDVDEILRLARNAGEMQPASIDETAGANAQEIAPSLLERLSSPPRIRIGLARDAAFSFYYPETLEVLTAMGVEIVPFSPLQDKGIPEDVDLLYFGGGFPEVFAGQLAENAQMLASVRAAIQRRVLVYAECGGYMYLGTSCIDATNTCYALVGALPYTFRMGTERAQLGYRELTLARDSMLGVAGTQLRGHEFHWSQIIEPLSQEYAAYQLTERSDIREGYASATILASYVHIPLAANAHALTMLLHNCLSHQQTREAPQKIRSE